MVTLAWELPVPTFNPQIAIGCPDECPPTSAVQRNGPLFRGIRELPISEDDFLSHVEHDDLNGDPTQCTHWGLSVWQSQEDAEHARNVHKYMRKWHVAGGVVDNDDGVFLETPRDIHPEHCTFWKAAGVNLADKFSIVLYPTNGGQRR